MEETGQAAGEGWKIKERQTKPCCGFVGMGNVNLEEDGKD